MAWSLSYLPPTINVKEVNSMGKNLKKSILALAVAAAVFAAGILVPMTGHVSMEHPAPEAVAFFLHPIIEGS